MSDKETASLKNRAAALLICSLVRILGRSCRLSYAQGGDRIAALGPDSEPLILCFWHNRLFYMASFFKTQLLNHGFRMSVLVSKSRDGELGTMLGESFGSNIVRGSSGKQGASGFKALYRALADDRRSVVLLPDGSKGPVYEAKAGVVALARLTGSPIVPMSYWADRFWRLRSWDRMIVPKPFARVAVAVGEPIWVARDLTEEELEAKRIEVQNALDEVGFAAERALGREPRKRVAMPAA